MEADLWAQDGLSGGQGAAQREGSWGCRAREAFSGRGPHRAQGFHRLPLPGPRSRDQGCGPSWLSPEGPPCPGPGVPKPPAEGQWELRAWARVRTHPPPALMAISLLLAPGRPQQPEGQAPGLGRWLEGRWQLRGPAAVRGALSLGAQWPPVPCFLGSQ